MIRSLALAVAALFAATSIASPADLTLPTDPEPPTVVAAPPPVLPTREPPRTNGFRVYGALVGGRTQMGVNSGGFQTDQNRTTMESLGNATLRECYAERVLRVVPCSVVTLFEPIETAVTRQWAAPRVGIGYDRVLSNPNLFLTLGVGFFADLTVLPGAGLSSTEDLLSPLGRDWGDTVVELEQGLEATIGARFGVFFTPKTYAYGLAGLSMLALSGHSELAVLTPGATADEQIDRSVEIQQNMLGPTVGFGLERMIGFNHSLGLEYRYTSFNKIELLNSMPPYLDATPNGWLAMYAFNELTELSTQSLALTYSWRF